jgi:hypothetical protein
MLWNASKIRGYAIAARDGRLGTVCDFLFDDASWLIRWLVVDTGNWLPGRKVLLPPSVLGHPDSMEQAFSVRLTRQQVEDSPDMGSDLPVSRQMESNVYNYYGWSPYWGGGLYMGATGYVGGAMAAPPSLGSRLPAAEVAFALRNDGDPHLRSTEVVGSYHIHARDGEIGHVEDFLVDDADWSVHYLVVDTQNWWPGKKVLISPRSVREIDPINRLVHLRAERQRVKDSPAYDAATLVDRTYEKHFHNHYEDDLPNDPMPSKVVVAEESSGRVLG